MKISIQLKLNKYRYSFTLEKLFELKHFRTFFALGISLNQSSNIVLLQASELTSGKLREVVESHKFLYFPRLSSRALFDELCPEERFRSLRRLVKLFL